MNGKIEEEKKSSNIAQLWRISKILWWFYVKNGVNLNVAVNLNDGNQGVIG